MTIKHLTKVGVIFLFVATGSTQAMDPQRKAKHVAQQLAVAEQMRQDVQRSVEEAAQKAKNEHEQKRLLELGQQQLGLYDRLMAHRRDL